jgi:hypothetical protein
MHEARASEVVETRRIEVTVMRRTVWIVLFTLLVLAVIGQSIALVERRTHGDSYTAQIEPDGSVVRMRTVPPRFEVSHATRGQSTSSRKPPTSTTRTSREPAPEFFEETFSVTSRPKVKPEAYNDALDKARFSLMDKLGLSRPPSREFVNKYVKEDHSEEPGPSDSVIGDTYIVKMDLKVSKDVWLKLAKFDRSVRIEERMSGMAAVMAVITAFLGCIAGYIRLDEWTKGYYTGRLRLLTLAVAALAVVGVAAVFG